VANTAGNKKDKLDIVYTPWENLKKTASMEVGQVGFFNDKLVRTADSNLQLHAQDVLFPSRHAARAAACSAALGRAERKATSAGRRLGKLDVPIPSLAPTRQF
jgi:membrane-associated phospholipid phosphatase